MALSDKHVSDVCNFNKKNECRYLDDDFDDKGGIVHVCKKRSPDRRVIDEEIELFKIEMKKQGADPYDQGVPIADNCSGYLKFVSKQQGYDVD